MGAGSYIGRVGGLAVALGIGAAVVAGAGAAAADDGPASKGATSESTSASSSESGTKATSKPDPTGPSHEETDAHGATSVGASGEKGTDASDDGASVKGAKPGNKHTTRADPSTDRDTLATAPKATADEPKATADDAAPVEETKAVSPDSVLGEVQPVAATETWTAATEVSAKGPVSTTAQVATQKVPVATTLVSGPAAIVHAEDSPDPVAPAAAALATLVVGAGRETTQVATQVATDASTTSQVAIADPKYPIPTNVEVTEWVAPLQWLQTIPIAGQLVVTPVVRFIHTIPLIGDVLHPFIGWPIDPYAAAGTPRPRTVQVTSFDGTKIFVNFMPAVGLKAGQTAPTVLDGPGLGLPGATTIDVTADGLLPTDVVGVGALRQAGYNVVTWDPRGEWLSGGVMYLNSPEFEGRDMSSIISWVASLPEARLDSVNDPRIGMVGASYGGGIQLATAAIDHRVDAIVPTIAWNNLVDVLFPRGAVNSVWGTLLPTVLAVTGQRPFPRIYPVAVQGVLFGIAEQSDLDLVNSLGFQDQIKDITAPTLLIQGTVDNLFTLDQADLNARALIAAGTTTKVIWYCGGHGTCLSDYNDGKVVIDRTLDWLARYLKDEDVDTGPQFEYVDQNGTWFGSDTYPAQNDTTPVEAESSDPKTLWYVPLLGGSGPNPLILTRGPISALLGLGSAAAAANAINLGVPAATALTHIVGAPELTMTYSGTGTAKMVYAQIVDDQSGLVLGNQVTPIPVVLDGATHTVTYSLEQVAQTLQPGQSLTVQILTSATKYFNFYSWGSITVDQVSIKLPTLGAATVAQEPVAAA